MRCFNSVHCIKIVHDDRSHGCLTKPTGINFHLNCVLDKITGCSRLKTVNRQQTTLVSSKFRNQDTGTLGPTLDDIISVHPHYKRSNNLKRGGMTFQADGSTSLNHVHAARSSISITRIARCGGLPSDSTFELSCLLGAQAFRPCPHQRAEKENPGEKGKNRSTTGPPPLTGGPWHVSWATTQPCSLRAALCSIVGLCHVSFGEVPLELHMVPSGPLVVAGDLPQESTRGTRWPVSTSKRPSATHAHSDST